MTPETPRYALRCGKGYLWGVGMDVRDLASRWRALPDRLKGAVSVWALDRAGSGRTIWRPAPTADAAMLKRAMSAGS